MVRSLTPLTELPLSNLRPAKPKLGIEGLMLGPGIGALLLPAELSPLLLLRGSPKDDDTGAKECMEVLMPSPAAFKLPRCKLELDEVFKLFKFNPEFTDEFSPPRCKFGLEEGMLRDPRGREPIEFDGGAGLSPLLVQVVLVGGALVLMLLSPEARLECRPPWRD
jgi:hypothetical protein